MSFENRVVVVTGGSKGIGGATSEAFLNEGAKVAVLDIEPPAFKGAGAEKLLFVKTDVAENAQVSPAFDKIKSTFGGVDVLVNNAGIQRYGTVADTPESTWDEVMGVNLKSYYLCAHRAVPMMQQRGKGVVINVASVRQPAQGGGVHHQQMCDPGSDALDRHRFCPGDPLRRGLPRHGRYAYASLGHQPVP
jgi:NAD(P)-dependent dehydrogenase (short-subunit alcohol dehydrogenase family)